MLNRTTGRNAPHPDVEEGRAECVVVHLRSEEGVCAPGSADPRQVCRGHARRCQHHKRTKLTTPTCTPRSTHSETAAAPS